MSDTKPLQIGFLIFPDLTQLDFTGPYEVFARLPDTRVHIVAKSSGPVRSDRGSCSFRPSPARPVRRSMSSWCRADRASRL
jgi:putative intracellular protease/amidase